MVGLIIFAIAMFGWMAFEIWRAPLMDEDGNILKEGNKLSNLFKKSIMKKIFEMIVFVLTLALGITILAFGFRVLYEAAKQIF